MSVVFIHGFLGAPSAWDAVVAQLPDATPAVRLTVMGHAGSPALGASFEEEVERLGRLALAGAGNRGVHLVGYSLGARLALAIAAARPSWVRRLTLVSGSAGLRDADERQARAQADDALAASLRAHGLEAFVDRWQALPLFASQRTLPDAIGVMHRARRLSHRADDLARALSVLSLGRMPALHRALASLPMPVDLVAGGLDPKFASLAHELAAERRAPYPTRLEVLADVGHDVTLERPEALASILVQVADYEHVEMQR